MRKEIKVSGISRGLDYFGQTLNKYFNEETKKVFKRSTSLEIVWDNNPHIKNLEALEVDTDIFFLNYINDLTYEVIKKVREINPKIKIICITTTIRSTEKQILDAGADVCFDCETIPVIQGGGFCGGAVVDLFAWIFKHFPEEAIENTWSIKS